MTDITVKINAHAIGLIREREYVSYTKFDAWTGEERKRAKELIDQLDSMYLREIEQERGK